MCKVSLLNFFRLINVSRCDFDVAMSTDESNDSISTIWSVSGWLHGAAMSQVSLLAVLCLFVTDALDLEPSRYSLDSIASTAGSNDLQATFWVVWEWLRDALAF